jgi:hypothetical protein
VLHHIKELLFLCLISLHYPLLASHIIPSFGACKDNAFYSSVKIFFELLSELVSIPEKRAAKVIPFLFPAKLFSLFLKLFSLAFLSQHVTLLKSRNARLFHSHQ